MDGCAEILGVFSNDYEKAKLAKELERIEVNVKKDMDSMGWAFPKTGEVLPKFSEYDDTGSLCSQCLKDQIGTDASTEVCEIYLRLHINTVDFSS